MALTNAELYHYGIKGQKWGVRRFQDKFGKLTSAGKKRYNDSDSKQDKPKESRYDKLYSQYKQVGYSDKKAKELAEGRVKVERSLKVIGGLTLTAAAVYVGYRYYDSHADRYISPDTVIQTVHKGDIKDRIAPGNPFYATYTKRDNTIYTSKVFGHFGTDSNVSHMYTKNGVKVASEKTGQKIYKELYEKDSEFRNYIDTFRQNGGVMGRKGNRLKREYDSFNYSLVINKDSPVDKALRAKGINLDHEGVHKKFYNELKKRGYGAVLDINDSKIEGFTYNPVIVFDDQIKHVISTTKATSEQLGTKQALKASVWATARDKLNHPVKALANKPVAIAGAAYLTNVLGVVKGNKDLTAQARYVDKYLKEHPNTKKSRKQIAKMYV